jgi:hypothetical protein
MTFLLRRMAGTREASRMVMNAAQRVFPKWVPKHQTIRARGGDPPPN